MRNFYLGRFGIVWLGTLCAALVALSCSSEFRTCVAYRSCPVDRMTDGGSAGESGAAGAHLDGGAGGTGSDGSASAGDPNAGAGGETEEGGTGGVGCNVGCNKADGVKCASNAECVSGACKTFFKDSDSDTFGSNREADKSAFCGTSPPVGYSTDAKDCCDTDKNAKPGQLLFFEASNNCDSFDYNCSGTNDLDPQQEHVAVETCEVPSKTCSVTSGWVGKQETTCGSSYYRRTGDCSFVEGDGGFCSFARVANLVRCR